MYLHLYISVSYLSTAIGTPPSVWSNELSQTISDATRQAKYTSVHNVIHRCVCIYIYMCIYIYTYTYTHT